jgi:hypothetical protein
MKRPLSKAEDRYQTDSSFHQLVDLIYVEIDRGHYTPSELREAVILAATMYEYRNARHLIYGPDLGIIQERFQTHVERTENGQ